MKYFLFGDIHGKSIEKLIPVLEKEDPNIVLCTGDFDQVKSIKEIMDLEIMLDDRDIDFFVVPGNHDDAIYNGLLINSGTIIEQNKTIYSLYDELKKDKMSHEYIGSLLENEWERNFYLDEEKFGKKYSVALRHCAFDGSLTSLERRCRRFEEIKDLWIRLKDYEDLEKNFSKMKEKGINLLVSGHDHNPLENHKGFFAYNHEEGINASWMSAGEEVELKPQYESVVNPGAYFRGYYAVIDTNKEKKYPIVRFENVDI
jgi:DNA repair exonuclease SbcCD nuclease subunit